MLVTGLPRESKTLTALDSTWAHLGPWSDDQLLLALVADRLALSNWMYAQARSKERLPVPKPIPRPGFAPVVDMAEERRRRAYLDRVRAGHGARIPRGG